MPLAIDRSRGVLPSEPTALDPLKRRQPRPLRGRLRRFLIRRPAALYAAATVASIGGILILAAWVGKWPVISDFDLFHWLAIPASLIAVTWGGVKVWQDALVARATFVKDYFSQFHARPEFYSAWYDLIYTYSTAKWFDIDAHVRERGTPLKFDDLNGFQERGRDKTKGNRFWHPRVPFQGSQEERRLDSLIGYFSVMGTYYGRGLISLEDIANSAGYYLAHVATHHAILEYIRILDADFAGGRNFVRLGKAHPFPDDLRELLWDLAWHFRAKPLSLEDTCWL
jgi:hypothetical protein